ncbi:MAG: efflux transporter outer membrane subunit [Desulfuromonadales bacterium]|nr:efflux transporter outer membrane subunit [Desulfuromonadales bacterium]
MKKRLLAIAAAAFLGLTGCTTMAPEYARPAAPVPAQWPTIPANQGDTAEGSAQLVADLHWQDFFADPKLRQLIALGLENNRDLRVAALNIERSRAQYQIRRAALFPRLAGVVAGSGQGIPADLSSTGNATTIHQYSVGLGVSSYELDLFGRIRSLKDQALKQYFATEQVRRSVQISLIGELANNYLALAADRERLALAQKTLANQQEGYRLINSRVAAGVSSVIDLNRARTSVEAARVDIARYTNLVARDENTLAALLGTPVPVDLLPAALTDGFYAVNELSPRLTSAVLLRRPDILQAENLLKAANANIGAARAAFFPRITLVGSFGTGSNELAGLFQAGSRAWSFAPQITVPIFTGGSNQANLEVAKIDREIAVARYEQAIQQAFREVADALAQKGTIDAQLAAQQALTDATAESFRLSQARYDNGADSYLAVLDSQRTLYAAQQGMITTRQTRLNNLATLYKVLGGGWQEHPQ